LRAWPELPMLGEQTSRQRAHALPWSYMLSAAQPAVGT
jgi:hypothetical protein